jgi:hypothetical protein
MVTFGALALYMIAALHGCQRETKDKPLEFNLKRKKKEDL